MTNKAIKFIAIAILTGISFLAVNAQEETVIATNEVSTATEKVEKKVEPKAKRQSSGEDSWTGFYVGGFGNISNSRANANTSTISGSQSFYTNASVATISTLGNQNIKSTEFNGGGTAGFNYRRGHFFVGGEADFGTSRVNKSVSANGQNPAQTANFTITQTVKTDWLFTARPRGGMAFKKALIYVTGGVAVTKIQYAENFTESRVISAESGSFRKTKTGWTAGAGAEFKIAKHWSVKGEYLFTQFSRTTITANNFVFSVLMLPSPNQTFTHSTDLKLHNIRFGVNYRF